MRMSRLFKKTLGIMIVLFGVIAVTTSTYSAWDLYSHLTREYEGKGLAIAQSIADASVEILLNRDASTVQALVDEFIEIDGVAYVYVVDEADEIVSHTFVPQVPDQVKALERTGREATTQELSVSGFGTIIEISMPILAGEVGYVHVGMSKRRITDAIWAAIATQQVLVFVIFLCGVAVAYLLINGVSRPLSLLTSLVDDLVGSDFQSPPTEEHAVLAESKDEIGTLARSILLMQTTLADHIRSLKETTAAKQQIEAELRAARDIQMELLPKTFPPFPGRSEFEIFASILPAREVGGDFYDFFFIDDDHLCFTVGDVSGKGVSAALYMAVTKTLIRANGAIGRSPGQVLRLVNDELRQGNDACMFVTVFLAVLNTRSGTMHYSNGGHNYPFVTRADRRLTVLDESHGPALGLLKTDYAEQSFSLDPGDALLAYTDGVTEAINPAEEMFSELRLEQLLRSSLGLGVKDTIQQVSARVKEFAAGAPQFDDQTILSIQYMGAAEAEG